MADDLEGLGAVVASLREIDRVGTAIAVRAQPGVLAAARATAAAGGSPTGEAWAPTKEGRAALPNAAAAIGVEVSGASRAVLVITLPVPYVFHQRSKSKSLPRRQVILEGEDGVPAPIVDAIERAAVDVIGETMRGGSR